MNTVEITTKAAKCPRCSKYHLIASIESYRDDEDTRNDFKVLTNKGFKMIDVTTQAAIDNFGYCVNPIQSNQGSLFPEYGQKIKFI